MDEPHQIIVAEAVTNQPPDVEHFAPVLEQVLANCGAAPKQVTADTGYFSEKNVARAEALGVAPFIATERWKRGEPPPAPPRGRPPASLTPKQKMRRKLLTKVGHAVYARRKATVEPVFGQIKQSRGLRQFLLRGIEKVRAEWSLICIDAQPAEAVPGRSAGVAVSVGAETVLEAVGAGDSEEPPTPRNRPIRPTGS